MKNSYKKPLDILYDRLLVYRQISFRINDVLKSDVEKYNKNKASLSLSNSLLIVDWSDKKRAARISTNSFKLITRETYSDEIEKVLSLKFCLLYSQSFEALETFLKDIIYIKSNKDDVFKQKVIKKLKKGLIFNRENIPTGKNLYSLLKEAGKDTFKEYSKSNIIKTGYYEFWTIISETRHAITHTQCQIKKSKINKSQTHFKVFEMLFNYSYINEEEILIQLDYLKFFKTIEYISSYAFQIFKTISIADKLDWQIYELNATQ